MKRIWFFIALLSIPLMAQTDLAKMEVVDTPVLSETEIVARRLPDGRFCAGIKVISDLEGFSYDSYLGVSGMDDKPGQDIIFTDPAERVLLLYHVGYEPLKIILSEYGIQLKERQMWEIKVKGGKVDILPVSFILNPKDAEVIIDGRNMGSGPTFQMKAGEHVVQVGKNGFIYKNDTINVNPNSVFFSYVLAIKPEMVFVEGGTFDMGDTFGDGDSNEKPVHKVTLNSFYIEKYEVTFAEYDLYCDATGRDKLSDEGWGKDNRSVIHISWYDAVEYCNWLSEQEGFSQCYTIDKTTKDLKNKSKYNKVKWLVSCNFSANGYRLPTEAEWEYACRGGLKSKGYKYSGSDKLEEVAWYCDNSNSITRQVGQKKSNELGIHDMSGNIAEWCWDWDSNDYYKMNDKNDPRGPDSGYSRVIRGGGKDYIKSGLRCSNRYGDKASNRLYLHGFRLCRTYIENENIKKEK